MGFPIKLNHITLKSDVRPERVGKLKVEALKDILTDINPEISDQIEIKPEGWQGKLMSGYIFLRADSIELRREIVEKHFDSP